MTLSKEDLAEFVEAGAVSDIFKAERAYGLLKTIGKDSDAINASKKNFGEVFGVIRRGMPVHEHPVPRCLG